jgi:hypothetical protein
MPPLDVLDLFNTRRQPGQQSNSELITSRNPDDFQARGGWRVEGIDDKGERRHSSGRTVHLDHGSGRKDGSTGIRRSATLSHRSRGKRDSRVEDDNGREKLTTNAPFVADGPVEDPDHVIAEEKKFSWGSFRLSRRRKKHTSTDTQKHEYGEHRLEERMRWSTQLPSLEIVPPPSSVDTTSSADRNHLPTIHDTPPSATMSALSQLEGRGYGTSFNPTFTIGDEQKSRKLRSPSQYDKPLPHPGNQYNRSYLEPDSNTTSGMDDATIESRFGKHMLSPIIGTPRSIESSSITQHSLREHRSQLVSSTSDTRQQPLSRPLLSVGVYDDNKFSLSRSISAQESSVYPLRRIPQRLNTTGSMGLQAGRAETTHGNEQSRRGHRQYTEHDDDVSMQASSSVKHKHDRREAIIMDRKAQGKMTSHHVASAATLGRGLTGVELLMDADMPRPFLTERPHSFARSTVQSVASGESRPEYRFSLERSTLNSELQAPSTSLMSLPTTPSGSGVLGPKPYQYLPLGEMEFRLVRVLPETMSTLKCEMCHRLLHDTLEDYIAISYAWGDGLDMKQLVLEGTKVLVPTSLYDALRAIRQKKHEVLVWVDALCINQQDKDERATQVRLMGHIYSCAESVAIWLGPEADESTRAMQLLHQVANHTVSPQRIRSVQMYSDSAALLAVFKRDYWRRLWVGCSNMRMFHVNSLTFQRLFKKFCSQRRREYTAVNQYFRGKSIKLLQKLSGARTVILIFDKDRPVFQT